MLVHATSPYRGEVQGLTCHEPHITITTSNMLNPAGEGKIPSARSRLVAAWLLKS